ncbi:hypothetical protein H0H81_009358 [Sphagnurus paluster]|uniref:Protein-tyrosine-phosphatase n=1 Tax=Sphagnurus paluster TaxID=117069 RepID=A0A9P7KI37_9AGAR|nr:hypothetical protein H0H81_009358 [Sphagnurus paluster]
MPLKKSTSKASTKTQKDAASLILSPYLYVGTRSSTTTAFLSAQGITHVLSIGATPASADAPGVTYHRLSLPDHQNAPIVDIVAAAEQIIALCEPTTSNLTGPARPDTMTTAQLTASINAAPVARKYQKNGKQEKKILVHCSAGISRSPMLVTAYLMRRCGMTLKEALGVIVRARPAACPNPGFMKQLREMDLDLRGESSIEIGALPARKEDRLALLSTVAP